VVVCVGSGEKTKCGENRENAHHATEFILGKDSPVQRKKGVHYRKKKKKTGGRKRQKVPGEVPGGKTIVDGARRDTDGTKKKKTVFHRLKTKEKKDNNKGKWVAEAEELREDPLRGFWGPNEKCQKGEKTSWDGVVTIRGSKKQEKN